MRDERPYGAGLPEPAVSPAAYDDEYYLKTCGGHEEWVASGGRAVAGIYYGALARADLRPGEVVVDIGTGRGELLAVAVEHGAARAVGIEYSPAAVALAEATIGVHAIADRAEVVLADARSIPVESDSADLVTMLDVVEHLAPAELQRSLAEAHRVLRPGGRILVHTFPTRTLYQVYHVQRALSRRRRQTWPPEPRNEFELLMHVNEQSVGRLRRALRDAGFDRVRSTPGEWVYTHHIPDERARRLYERLACLPITRRLGAANLWGAGIKALAG